MRMLREIVREEEMYMQQSTAVTLATLIVAEYRAGDIAAAKCHATGLQVWINFHGGYDFINTLNFFAGICLLNTFVYFDFNIFHSKEALGRALVRMELPCGSVLPGLSRYFSIQDSGSQATVLYLLNLISVMNIPGFVEQLQDQVHDNSYMAPGAMLYIIAKCLFQLGQWQALQSGKTIEFVRLLSFAKTKTRLAVLDFLSQNLIGTKPMPIDFEVAKEEIRLAWTKERSLHRKPRRVKNRMTDTSTTKPSSQMVFPSGESHWSGDGSMKGFTSIAPGLSQQPRRFQCPMRFR